MAHEGALTSVRLIGTFVVERAGQVLTDAELGSRKARTLLKVLAVRCGGFVATDTVVDALWGDTPPGKAVENVATLVSRLRGVLGEDVIEGDRRGYRLNLPIGCPLDLDEAERLVTEAATRMSAGQPTLAATASARARELLGTGAVLTEESDAPWADEAKRGAATLLRQAREIGWRVHFALDDHRAGLLIAERAIADDPLDEDAHRAVILAHHQLGEPGKALQSYERLRALLADAFGADPAPDTEALYLTVLRGERIEVQVDTASSVHASSGFVGRDDELHFLLDAWEHATNGAPSCVLISGQAGIGKTRLAGELVRHARGTGALAIESRCYEAERSLFLQPIVEAIRGLVTTLPAEVTREAARADPGPLATLVPEIAHLLGPQDYRPAGAELERRRVFEAIGSFLARLARRRPILLVLDDLHEAGASTVELCHFVLRWEQGARLLIVGTTRSDLDDEVVGQLEPLSTTVHLGPLPSNAVYTLASNVGLNDLAPQLMEMTRGHTLFVIEALRAVRESSTPTHTIPVPASLRAAVLTRMARSGEAVEELLRAAVVVGSAFELDAVAALLDIPVEDAVRRAESALRAGLLDEVGNAYEFANDLVRDIIYESVPRPSRTARHRWLAERMADQPEAAASHAAAAGDWAVAANRWVEAADRSVAAFANQEAELLLSRAVTACEHLDNPALAAHVRLLRGRARLARSHYADATDDLVEAEHLARNADEAQTEADAIAEQAWVAYHARSMQVAHTLSERAAAHPNAGSAAIVLVGRMRNAAGDLSGALTAFESVTDDPQLRVRARALSYLGTALAHSDRYADAVHVLDSASELCRQAGLLRPMFNAWMFEAMSHANLGDFETALRWTTRLHHDAERFGSDSYLPRALNIEAWIWRELGEPSRAHDLADEALARCVMPDGETEGEPAANALLQLAESALLRGDAADAEHRLKQISSYAEDVGYAWRIELRRLELAARLNPEQAQRLLDLARHNGSSKYAALALAQLGQREQAITVARRTGSLYLLARVGPEHEAKAAVERLAAQLPDTLRANFLRRGPVTHGHSTS